MMEIQTAAQQAVVPIDKVTRPFVGSLSGSPVANNSHQRVAVMKLEVDRIHRGRLTRPPASKVQIT